MAATDRCCWPTAGEGEAGNAGEGEAAGKAEEGPVDGEYNMGDESAKGSTEQLKDPSKNQSVNFDPSRVEMKEQDANHAFRDYNPNDPKDSNHRWNEFPGAENLDPAGRAKLARPAINNVLRNPTSVNYESTSVKGGYSQWRVTGEYKGHTIQVVVRVYGDGHVQIMNAWIPGGYGPGNPTGIR